MQILPCRQAYEYEPLPQTLNPSLSSFVLGIEAPLWTEWVPTRKARGISAFPRLIAFAETEWTPQASKNFPSFHTRLANFEARLDLLKVRYAKDFRNSFQFVPKIHWQDVSVCIVEPCVKLKINQFLFRS